MHGREERCEEEEIWERGSIATPEHMHTRQTPGCAGRGRAAMRVTCSVQCQHPPEGIPQHSRGPGTVQLREESRGTCHLSPSEPRCVMKLKAAARTAGRYLHRQLSLFKNSELEQDSNSWSAKELKQVGNAQPGHSRRCSAHPRCRHRLGPSCSMLLFLLSPPLRALPAVSAWQGKGRWI